MTISEKIYELLRVRGMPMTTFSKLSGIPKSTISEWKNKGLNPSSDKIMNICNLLEVDPYELLTTESYGRKYISVDKDSLEFILIDKFRGLPPLKKEKIIGYIDGIVDEVKYQEKQQDQEKQQ